jgi:thiaminase
MSLIPNIPPKLFSLSAIAVGYLLIDDTTANEQNALGNWLMLIAQVLCTNAFYKQVMQERGLDFSNSNNNNYYNMNYSENDINQTVEMLKKMVNALNQEINEIKKSH